MKRIITYSVLAVFITLVFTSCVKERVFDERYWLSQERGVVVYSTNCSHYVVETRNGYTVIRNLNRQPYEGDVLYGDFSNYGSRDFYNYTEGTIISGNVKDYWLTYVGAQQAVDYYCY